MHSYLCPTVHQYCEFGDNASDIFPDIILAMFQDTQTGEKDYAFGRGKKRHCSDLVQWFDAVGSVTEILEGYRYVTCKKVLPRTTQHQKTECACANAVWCVCDDVRSRGRPASNRSS